MRVSIEKEVAQAILTYLAKQPYGEVFNLVGALVGAKPVPEPPKAVEAPPSPDKGMLES